MLNTSTIYFKEEQKIREAWLWIILAVAALVSLGGVIATAFMKQETPMDTMIALAIVVPVQVLVFGAIYFSKLQTKVSEEGIQYRFYPFQRKYRLITRSEISEFYVRDVPLFKRGLSFVFGYGWMYNTSGGKGIQFKLKSGRKVFIGSQRISTLRSAIESLMHFKN